MRRWGRRGVGCPGVARTCGEAGPGLLRGVAGRAPSAFHARKLSTEVARWAGRWVRRQRSAARSCSGAGGAAVGVGLDARSAQTQRPRREGLAQRGRTAPAAHDPQPVQPALPSHQARLVPRHALLGAQVGQIQVVGVVAPPRGRGVHARVHRLVLRSLGGSGLCGWNWSEVGWCREGWGGVGWGRGGHVEKRRATGQGGRAPAAPLRRPRRKTAWQPPLADALQRLGRSLGCAARYTAAAGFSPGRRRYTAGGYAGLTAPHLGRLKVPANDLEAGPLRKAVELGACMETGRGGRRRRRAAKGAAAVTGRGGRGWGQHWGLHRPPRQRAHLTC